MRLGPLSNRETAGSSVAQAVWVVTARSMSPRLEECALRQRARNQGIPAPHAGRGMNAGRLALHFDWRAGSGKRPVQPSGKWGVCPCRNLNFGETYEKASYRIRVGPDFSTGAAFAQSNTSDVEQIGSSNTATVGQQIGTGVSNTSNVYQGSGGNIDPSSSSQAIVAQIGGGGSILSSTVQQNDNYQIANVSQTATAGAQTSTVTQSGNPWVGNTANVTQSATGGSQTSTVTQSNTGQWWGGTNNATVNQTGSADVSTITQTSYGSNAGWTSGSTGALGTVSGGVNVNQSGASSNGSTVNQSSSYSGVNVQQTGSLTGLNTSTVIQDAGGSYNAAAVSQTANAGVTNWSTLEQTGSWNLAGVQQDGAGTGSNTSGLTQNGGSNTASVWQSANATGVINSSTVGQTGSSNYASVRQH